MAAEPVKIAHPKSEFWTVVTDFVFSAACAVFALRLQLITPRTSATR
jgi:hypothetical protein